MEKTTEEKAIVFLGGFLNKNRQIDNPISHAVPAFFTQEKLNYQAETQLKKEIVSLFVRLTALYKEWKIYLSCPESGINITEKEIYEFLKNNNLEIKKCPRTNGAICPFILRNELENFKLLINPEVKSLNFTRVHQGSFN